MFCQNHVHTFFNDLDIKEPPLERLSQFLQDAPFPLHSEPLPIPSSTLLLSENLQDPVPYGDQNSPARVREKRSCTFCGQLCDSSFKAKNGKIHVYKHRKPFHGGKPSTLSLQDELRKRCPCTDSEIKSFTDQGMFIFNPKFINFFFLSYHTMPQG